MPTTAELVARYALPPDLVPYIDDGTLQFLSENPERHTVTFWIPSMNETKRGEVVKTYEVVWTHPDHMADMDFELEVNFYVESETEDMGRDFIDNEGRDMNSLDDLLSLLEDAREWKHDR